MKGIILAGGAGTRMFPMTTAVSKQLLPIYDKPMIYYPLATLMAGGIREILVISQKRNVPLFAQLLGSGSEMGVNICYATQEDPKGIAEALTIAADCRFWAADTEPITLILGDNIFDGGPVGPELQAAAERARSGRGTVYLTRVADPARYGVGVFAGNQLVRIVEKPERPPSSMAVTGLYVYPPKTADIVRSLEPSERGELEITDVNQQLLDAKLLDATLFGPGTAWLDTGTPESMLQASHYVQTIQGRQARLVGSPHMTGVENDWLTASELCNQVMIYNSQYVKQLLYWAEARTRSG